MKYFLIFGERENLSLSKDAKMNFEIAVKTLKKQNQQLQAKRQTGYVQVHLTDLNEELTVLFDLELPVENIQDYILNRIKAESEDNSLVNQLKELIEDNSLDDTQVHESIVIQEEPEIKEVKPRKQTLNIPEFTKPKSKAVSEEEPTKKAEKSVESQSQQRKREKKNIKKNILNIPKLKVEKITKNKGKIIASACILILSIIILAQNNKIKTLQNNINVVESTQKNQPSIDILVRYFLASYFSGKKEHCLDYVSKDVYNNLNVQNAHINLVFVKSVEATEKKGVYHVTYIVLTSQDDKVNSQKLTFDVKKNSTSKFDFEIVTQPKLSKF